MTTAKMTFVIDSITYIYNVGEDFVWDETNNNKIPLKDVNINDNMSFYEIENAIKKFLGIKPKVSDEGVW